MKKIAFFINPIESLNRHKDTTLALMLEAQAFGYQCYFFLKDSLKIENNRVFADLCSINVGEPLITAPIDVGTSKTQPLTNMDAIFIRQDPPFDSAYLNATYLLEKVHNAGTPIFNRPDSVRNCNEKLFALDFPQCCPPHCVTSQKAILLDFLDRHSDIVVKPLDSMGGESIFRLQKSDLNTNVILETVTQNETRLIMAQKYIPEITAGDKRVLLVHGEAIAFALARIPASGEFRGNLAAGGKGVVQPLSDRDQWICDQVSLALIDKGLAFVGLDIIGDYLTEINVTSPTCVREIEAHKNVKIAHKLFSGLKL